MWPTCACCASCRKNFANKDWVKVPKIDWEHTTSEILTMEYCPGIKINRAQQLDAQVRLRCSPCLAARHDWLLTTAEPHVNFHPVWHPNDLGHDASHLAVGA